MVVLYRDESPPTAFDVEVDEKLAGLSRKFGLTHYSYQVRLVPGEIERDLVVYTSYPFEWISTYVDQDYVQIDPLISLAQYNIMPIDWDDVDRRDPKVDRLFKQRAQFGVGPRGVTIPIRGAVGDFALFNVTSTEDRESWVKRLPDLVGDIVVAAYEIHSAVMQVWVEGDLATRPLSTRERQVLTLAGQGLPHKSVAFALAISESAVKLYLDSARQKLGAQNTAQAIAHAVSRHLIASPP